MRNLRFFITLVPRRYVITTYLIPDTSNFSFIVAIYIQITQLSCNGTSTHYITVFCRILPCSASYNILPNSASRILPSSASYNILPNPASYNFLPNPASYNFLLNSTSYNFLPNSASYISALAALAIFFIPF